MQRRRPSPWRTPRRRVTADAVCYLSPFENHPRAVSVLAAGRALWGNSPATLRRVRNPFELRDVLTRKGFVVPRLRNDPNVSNVSNVSNDSNDSYDWLHKPFRSGGGNRIRHWSGEPVPRTSYLQERIDGIPGSIVFVAAERTLRSARMVASTRRRSELRRDRLSVLRQHPRSARRSAVRPRTRAFRGCHRTRPVRRVRIPTRRDQWPRLHRA